MREAGQVAAPAGLDARYEHLRHAVLHERAQAFPLGLAILTTRGITAWQRTVTSLTTTPGSPPPSPPAGSAPGPGAIPTQAGPCTPAPDLPAAQVSARLVHALADLAAALAGT